MAAAAWGQHGISVSGNVSDQALLGVAGANVAVTSETVPAAIVSGLKVAPVSESPGAPAASPHSRTRALTLTGTYSVTFPMLELDTTDTHANLSYVFADGDKFCDASFAWHLRAAACSNAVV